MKHIRLTATLDLESLVSQLTSELDAESLLELIKTIDLFAQDFEFTKSVLAHFQQEVDDFEKE